MDIEGGVLTVTLHGGCEMGQLTIPIFVCVSVNISDCRLEISTLSRIFYLEELHRFSWMIQSSSDLFLGMFCSLSLSPPRRASTIN